MKYSDENRPLICMQTQSTCYKGTRTMTPLGVLFHSTAANNPYISRYVQPSDDAPDKDEMLKILGVNKNHNDWNHISREAGLNAWIGKLADGTVTTVQTMPWNFRPWGCGSGSKGSCNSGWIQFEICEDNLGDSTYFNQVYTEACELTAYLCKTFGIDPHGTVTVNGVKIPTILCHQDSYRLGFGGNHADIYHWFPLFGKDMETVRNDVAAILEEDDGMLSYEQWVEYMERYRKEMGKAPAASYAKPSIKTCVEAGVMSNTGTPEDPTIDRPCDFLLRQEAAVMMGQMLKRGDK